MQTIVRENVGKVTRNYRVNQRVNKRNFSICNEKYAVKSRIFPILFLPYRGHGNYYAQTARWLPF